jgi:hypothetical protein
MPDHRNVTEPRGVPEVLFGCVYNAGRSQMAAALLDHHAGGRVRVSSAGSTPADEITAPFAPRWPRWGSTRIARSPGASPLTPSPLPTWW